jgi:type VI secretion system protein ImpC
MRDLKGVLEGTAYAAWRGFRDSEDSRYVGLTAPRFLLRMPYGKDNTIGAGRFNYEEQVTKDHDNYMWGNAAFAFATRLTESFAKYRWCANIIGPRGGGEVRNLPVHLFKSPKGDLVAKIPTEILISDRREYEMAEEGFIALTMRKDENNASFFSANSAQRAKTFGISEKGKDAETNFRLGTQLPYMFVISRLAHYIKVIQRENIGTFKERGDLEKELQQWINQYVSDMDDPQPGVRATRPIRKASIAVEDVPGQPGWYKVDMKIRPHFKYMGAYFTLSLVGKLDKK